MRPGDADRANSYDLRLTFFLNAKHQVPLAGSTGPAHRHSWRLDVVFEAAFHEREAVPGVEFADVERVVRDVLRPYEGCFLNEMPPFDRVIPATENLARFLYGAIGRAVSGLGVRIVDVTLWETPTKGVTVRAPLSAAHAGFLREAAATGEELPGRVRGVPTARDPGSDRRGRPGERGAVLLGLLAPLLVLLAVGGLTAVVYLPLLKPLTGPSFPWGSDTWGHLFKAYYLYQSAAAGNLYPALMPWWYAGIEPFRYWAPLPYYALAALRYFSGSIFTAGAWLVPLCALFGGLSWLAFARRLGWLGACVAGLGWAVWPDHVRVALSEGNLPRVVATALLPLLFATFLDSLERRRWPWPGLAFVVVLNLVVLSHAMVAAIACLGLAAFSLLFWCFSGTRGRDVVRGAALIVLGLLVSSWWLVPSLSGGIAAIDPEAVRQAADYFPLSVSLNPLIRQTNPEVFYLGLSSAVLLVLVLTGWSRRDPLARAFFVCALLAIVITFPAARPLVSLLPGSQLLWPLRFASLLPIALFLAALPRPSPLPAAGPPPSEPPSRVAASGRRRLKPAEAALTFLIAAIVLADASGSFHLIGTRAARSDLAEAADALRGKDGWRVAVLDLSRLGSEPSFVFSQSGGREQVFGWAWQGAAIGPGLVLLNTALEQGRYTYAVDRSLQLGATDLVVPTGWVDASRLAPAAVQAGYSERETYGHLDLYRRFLPPFALRHTYEVLAVGRYAGNASLLFPAVERGTSPYIDSYDLADLRSYRAVFLTGATWRSRSRAEDLIRAYVAAGGRVVVDLTGFPTSVLSKRPSFLGVVGEPVQLTGATTASGPLGPVGPLTWSPLYDPWAAFIPHGLDRSLLAFEYFGQSADIIGEKDLDGGPVTFVGLNLPYHALLTGDPAALDMLAGLLGVEPDEPPARETLPLASYRATARGYSFTVDVPGGWDGARLILPFAHHDAVKVALDGRPVPVRPVENLIAVEVAAGRHRVDIEATRPPLAGVSVLVSATAFVLLAAYSVVTALQARTGRKEVSV